MKFSLSIRAALSGGPVTWVPGHCRRESTTTSEDAETAARREFKEELGVDAVGPLQSLGEVRQRAGKIVRGYAMEGDLDVSAVRSNDVAIEWPPRSGRTIHFPEIDRAAWFALSPRPGEDSSQPTTISRSSGNDVEDRVATARSEGITVTADRSTWWNILRTESFSPTIHVAKRTLSRHVTCGGLAAYA